MEYDDDQLNIISLKFERDNSSKEELVNQKNFHVFWLKEQEKCD